MGAQEDFEELTAWADRFKLDGEEREGYISSGMKRLGHKARQIWEDATPDDSEDEGDFFSRKRKEKTASNGKDANGSWLYPNSGNR